MTHTQHTQRLEGLRSISGAPAHEATSVAPPGGRVERLCIPAPSVCNTPLRDVTQTVPVETGVGA